MTSKRELIQQTYLRICSDTNYNIGYIDAAHLTGKVVGVTGIEVLEAFGFDNMVSVSKGTHPICKA